MNEYLDKKMKLSRFWHLCFFYFIIWYWQIYVQTV